MLTAANPYAKSALTAHGLWSEHMYAEPPSQPDAVLAASEPVSGESSLLQDCTGLETSALSGQEHEALQQSQSALL